MVDAVVLDLFGTLVAAPTAADRRTASARLASRIGCDATRVDEYFLASWTIRHDGTLPTVSRLAEHLLTYIDGPPSVVELVADELRVLGRQRLRVDDSVVEMLTLLRRGGLKIGVLSDAAAEIADRWQASRLAPLVDTVVFSCHFGATKPDQRLYRAVFQRLDVPPSSIVYCGDGGGDELRGADAAGMAAVRVRRRGGPDALVFGLYGWTGPTISLAEELPAYVASG